MQQMTVKQQIDRELDVLTVDKQKTIQDCSLLMKKYQIHHLPVMDEKGDLVGMISASDFLVVAEAMGRAPGEQIV